VYGYGSLGFIYADVETKLSMVAGEDNKVDVIFQIEEGDRWKIGRILAQIEGEPHLIQETYLLNQIDLVEGQYFDRRKLETNRRRLTNLQVFENNPSIADPPDIKVVPRDEAFEY
jgi:outer membrane protein insertion porin family